MSKSVQAAVRELFRKKRPAILNYESLEQRQVLAAIFPTYVDGVFTLGDADAGSPYALEDTFKLSTNPSASKTIYLDFNGYHSFNNAWGHDIQFDPYDRDGDPANFSDAELIEIQRIFQNVAEDFSPFEVNVTTIEPDIEKLRKTSSSDTEYGIRVVHTQATPEFGGFGGIAFLNSFDDNIDNPCFAINKGVNVGAMTISHEVGHTLGLSHDGLNSQAYHPGTGTGTLSWGPIMGAPFSSNITQWSKGEYVGNTTTQDDLAIITSNANGFGYKADDHGNTIATATNIDMASSTEIFDWGIISKSSDVDLFRIKAGAGNLNLSIKAFEENPNLDISAELLDSAGNVIATSNPDDDVNASFNMTVANGTYYLRIDGVGNDNNNNTDYGSLGFYSISGTVVQPILTIGETGVLTNVNSNWQTISFDNDFADPVVIAGVPSRNGGDPITIRIRNVRNDSFEIRVDEWDYRDGKHGRETVSYMVVERGTYQLANGEVLVAGTTISNHRWSSASFDSDISFSSTPVVLTQLTTNNEGDAALSRIRNVNLDGFQVRVQEEQAADFVHANETVSFIAIGTGMGVQDTAAFEVGMTPNAVTHQAYRINFDQSFSETPAFFASIQSYNGGDPASIRYRHLQSNTARIYLEEERSLDREIQHNPEVVGYFAIESGPITLVPTGNAPLAFMQNQYHNTNDPARLNAALQEQQSWGEEFTPFHEHDHDDHDHSMLPPGAIEIAAFVNAGTLDTALESEVETGMQVEQSYEGRSLNLAGAVMAFQSSADQYFSNFGSEDLDEDGIKLGERILPAVAT
ncbi:MAG: zinc-dependent metalloprotease family protein [Pirellulaceae bacterium]